MITVENANIRYTLNVVCTWDAQRQINVVKSISQGIGNSTPAIQLDAADFLIACHDWETGIPESDDPVEYSGTNYAILSNLSVGDGIRLSGVTALNAGTDVVPAAFLKFIPKGAVRISGENHFVYSGESVMFTPDFNGGELTPENSNINNTLNLLAQWDQERFAWVVADKFVGSTGLTLTDGQILFACHLGTSTGEAYYYNWLNNATVGQKVNFSGISPTDGAVRLSLSANISFTDLVTPDEPEKEVIPSVLLSQGLSYSLKKPGTAVHTANLTVGIAIDALNTTGGWFGFLSVTESANYNTDENGIGYVSLDLGSSYALDQFRTHIFAGQNSASIGVPDFIDVYVSNNGNDFAYAGSMSMSAGATSSFWAQLENANATGRYVKFAIGPSGNAAWVFVNEIEVWGKDLTGAEHIALGTGQITTGANDHNGKQGAFVNNKGFVKRYPAISFEGAFCINYFFTPAYAPVGEITLYYWNAADFESVDVMTAQNASGSLTMELQANGEYRADIAGIAAKALSEGVYVAGVYTDGTTTHTSGVLGYSIGAYCARQSTKGGTIADLAMATAVYGYQAKQYFG